MTREDLQQLGRDTGAALVLLAAAGVGLAVAGLVGGCVGALLSGV